VLGLFVMLQPLSTPADTLCDGMGWMDGVLWDERGVGGGIRSIDRLG
jgi:hypothetical protein